MNRIIIIHFIFLFCISSKIYKSNSIQIKPKIESLTTSIKSNGYTLLVKSSIVNDSIDSSSKYYSYPIFIEQTVFVYHNNKLIFKRNHPSKKVYFITFHKQKIKALENRLYEIGILKNNKSLLFYLDGWGGCTDCSTYMELINRNGKTVFLDYSDKFKIFKSKGNFNNELKKRYIDYNENINKIKLFKKIKI